MGERVRCFLIEETGQIELSLRRWRDSEKSRCSVNPYGYHNASVVIERVFSGELRARGWPWDEDHGPVHTIDTIPTTDPRWPRACECGVEFAADDHWQCNPHGLFRRVDGQGDLFLLSDAPVGAMWDATWYHTDADWCGPDGKALNVMLPGRTPWHIDGHAVGGGRWSRTGAAPDITARPSILVHGRGSYHGFLTDGWLEEC